MLVVVLLEQVEKPLSRKRTHTAHVLCCCVAKKGKYRASMIDPDVLFVLACLSAY
jgi:hypothetical protein